MSDSKSSLRDQTRLPADELRWRCDSDCLDFETTDDLETPGELVAQQTAREALEFGILSRARGQNVYVRGARGTGRRTMVLRLLHELRSEVADKVELRDHCYVHNFRQGDRPRLITVPAGKGQEFRRRMKEVARFIEEDLVKLLDADSLVAERRAIEADYQAQIREITEPLEKELEGHGMKLVQIQQGPAMGTAIVPVVDGKPMPPPELEQAVAAGEAPQELLDQYKALLPSYQQRVQDVSIRVMALQQELGDQIRKQVSDTARALVSEQVARLRADFRQEAMSTFLDEVVDDVVENRLRPPLSGQTFDPERRYGVNVIHEAPLDLEPPVIEETAPTISNLLGTVELGWNSEGPAPPDYMDVRAGALLRADGGFLVLDLYDLLSEPASWRSLMRTLRSRKLEIVPPEMAWFRTRGLLSPDPIAVDVRVILIGDARLYYLLDSGDPDFVELFKVLADFDHELPREKSGMRNYASVIAQIAEKEGLLPFSRDAVAALAEHGARIASRADKLTARFGRLGDIAREASFVAERAGAALVADGHVTEAVRRTKKRASLPKTKFQELIESGVIRIETSGEEVGQVNGLAVIGAGPITYGFPARITATIGVGRSGLIDIEATANLSGSIHTKGFQILNGLLRYLLKAEHPLAFSASLAFEQSYGGIDGDSASGAETCCLLSALTGVPLSQSLAMTGAIDQFGHIQAIGGVNEKIEGFYDTCASCARFGLTGEQGVVIPRSNAGDLMLREDVVEACRAGNFHVFAVDTIQQALEIFTGMPAGEWDEETQSYSEGSLLSLAVEKARSYWTLASRSPATGGKKAPTDGEENGVADPPAPPPGIPEG